MNDGSVKTHVSSEASPGILKGENGPKDEALAKLSKAIKPNDARFCSWAASLSDQKMESVSGSSSKGDEAYIQNIIQGQNLQALNEYSVTQLRQATRLEITVDGAFFEDGTFVGPNTTGYFERIEAQIKARRDIIQETINGLQEKKKPHEALQHLEHLSNAPDIVLALE